jgi:hypothetical protein
MRGGPQPKPPVASHGRRWGARRRLVLVRSGSAIEPQEPAEVRLVGSAATGEQPDPGYREQGDQNDEDLRGTVRKVRAAAHHELADQEQRDENQGCAGSEGAPHGLPA